MINKDKSTVMVHSAIMHARGQESRVDATMQAIDNIQR